LKHDQQIRIQRAQRFLSIGNEKDFFVGLPLSILILEALIVCYVLKVSYELGCTGSASALQGIHSENGAKLLSRLMAIKGARWQEVFLLNIIRVGGNACLLQMLDSNELLKQCSWTKRWTSGLPKYKKGREDELRKAEANLHEMEREEDRKQREIQLCPHCGQYFMIAQMNCGRFICGRHNTHTTPHKGRNGCGREFHASQARFYERDEKKLIQLRLLVQEEKGKLNKYLERSRSWEKLEESSLPFLTSTFSLNSYAPTATLTEVGGCDILKHILNYEKFVEQFTMLPDLIEVSTDIEN